MSREDSGSEHNKTHTSLSTRLTQLIRENDKHWNNINQNLHKLMKVGMIDIKVIIRYLQLQSVKYVNNEMCCISINC